MRDKTAPPKARRSSAARSTTSGARSPAAPQDVPLGLCAYPSVAREDLLDCDAIFDPLDGSPEWGFPNYLLAHNPAHRWYYYSDMTPDEAIVFKTSESDPDARAADAARRVRQPARRRRRPAAREPRDARDLLLVRLSVAAGRARG